MTLGNIEDGRVQIGSGRVDPVNVFRAIEGLGWKKKVFGTNDIRFEGRQGVEKDPKKLQHMLEIADQNAVVILDWISHQPARPGIRYIK
jgi:hypothetical protein